LIDKTHFLIALRPFSFVVAISSCLLGVVLGLSDGGDNIFLAGLLVLTGLILQAGVNLINDYSDRNHQEYNTEQRQRIVRNMQVGRGLFILVIISGLYMVSIRGLPLLLLGFAGLVGAWGYTSDTINYKQRGLGVVLVFFLMGIMMIGGCYYTLTGTYSGYILFLSLPFSLFTSLLLLANELRDYEKDKNKAIATLTVRIGFIHSTRLYKIFLLLIYISSIFLVYKEMLSTLLLLLLSIIALPAPLRLLRADADNRNKLPQFTGRLYLIYSSAFLITLIMEPSLPI